MEFRAKEYNRFQFTLELQQTPFFNVEEARTQLKVRHALWNSLKNWGELVEKWNKMPFDVIDVQDISEVSERYSKTVSSCEITLPEGATAVQELKKLVFRFKETMPIVVALGNRHLEKVHWD